MKSLCIALTVFWLPFEAVHSIWKLLSAWLSNCLCQMFKQNLFEYYLFLPPELRMMIIDRMEPEDRCRFRRCSKLSDKEAKASKQYIYSLRFVVCEENGIHISVMHNNCDSLRYTSFGLKFEDENEKKWMKYIIPNLHVTSLDDIEIELWREELNSSTDLVLYAAEYFVKLIKPHQNTIRELVFYGNIFTTKLKDYDYGIEKLKNLEDLDINGHMDVPSYFSKLRHPLKRFSLSGIGNNHSLTKSEEIYRVQNYLKMSETKFTNEQFLQLSAPIVHIDIGYLTEIDIFNFIRSWQNGTIGKEVEYYEWRYLENPNFGINYLFRLLGLEKDDDEDDANVGENIITFQILHYKEAGKRAKLSCYGNEYLYFKVFCQRE